MIWFDVAVTLLLTLRLVLFGPRPPRLFDAEGDPSPLTSEEGQEENASVDGEEGEFPFSSPKLSFATLRVLQLHIHVISDLDGTL